ncbi:MAG: single-stranded DNA-binding protein [Microbacterium sp.]
MSDQITVVGNVATRPTTTTLPNGGQALRFRLATNHRKYDRENSTWIDGDANFYSVSAYRALAEHGAASIEKGMRVIVAGRLHVRDWSTEKSRGTDVEVIADALGTDLLFGTTTYRKSIGGARQQAALQTAETAPVSQDQVDGWAAPPGANEAPPPAEPVAWDTTLPPDDTPF